MGKYMIPYHMREYSRVCSRCDKMFKGTQHSKICENCKEGKYKTKIVESLVS